MDHSKIARKTGVIGEKSKKARRLPMPKLKRKDIVVSCGSWHEHYFMLVLIVHVQYFYRQFKKAKKRITYARTLREVEKYFTANLDPKDLEENKKLTPWR